MRRARARKRRRAGYTGDDDDYDHGEDYDGDVDYGVDFDDSDEDMEGFTEEEQKRLGKGVQHSRDIFQSNTSSNDISTFIVRTFSSGESDESFLVWRRKLRPRNTGAHLRGRAIHLMPLKRKVSLNRLFAPKMTHKGLK